LYQKSQVHPTIVLEEKLYLKLNSLTFNVCYRYILAKLFSSIIFIAFYYLHTDSCQSFKRNEWFICI